MSKHSYYRYIGLCLGIHELSKKSEAKLLCCLSEWIIGFLDMRIGGVG